MHCNSEQLNITYEDRWQGQGQGAYNTWPQPIIHISPFFKINKAAHLPSGHHKTLFKKKERKC